MQFDSIRIFTESISPSQSQFAFLYLYAKLKQIVLERILDRKDASGRPLDFLTHPPSLGSSGPRPTPHTTLHHRAHGAGPLSPGLTPHLGYRIDLVLVARIDMRTKRAFTWKGKVRLRLSRLQMAAR